MLLIYSKSVHQCYVMIIYLHFSVNDHHSILVSCTLLGPIIFCIELNILTDYILARNIVVRLVFLMEPISVILNSGHTESRCCSCRIKKKKERCKTYKTQKVLLSAPESENTYLGSCPKCNLVAKATAHCIYI